MNWDKLRQYRIGSHDKLADWVGRANRDLDRAYAGVVRDNLGQPYCEAISDLEYAIMKIANQQGDPNLVGLLAPYCRATGNETLEILASLSREALLQVKRLIELDNRDADDKATRH